MKRETKHWVERAERLWNMANLEMQARSPVWEVVCFLAPQSAEQYLKAFLEEQGIEYRLTHDPLVLLDACAGALPELEEYRQDLAYLATMGLGARRPVTEADQRSAREALRIAEEVRSVVRNRLGM